APIELAGSYLPVLNFAAWFQALDFSNPQQPQDLTDVKLLVEGSTDEGKTWVALDTVSATQSNWQPRQVALDGKLDTAGRLFLRFTASTPAANDSIEAGI